MRHLMKLLIVPLLAFFSCSQQINGVWEENELPKESEMHPVGVRFSKSSIETFAEQGITEVGIYVYLEDSMVFGKTFPLSDANLEVTLPLGENLETFAVANADQLIDVDSLSKVMIRQNDNMQKPVYISDIVKFASDKSVSSLNLELKRLVGQALFQPDEAEEVLASVTQFNQLNITFTNVGVAYKVKSKESIQENVTVKTDFAAGYRAAVYSFPTLKAGTRTSVDVAYLKDDVEVNRIVSPLDTGIAFESSKRSVVHISVLEEDYLDNPSWTVTRAARNTEVLSQPFTIEESEF